MNHCSTTIPFYPSILTFPFSPAMYTQMSDEGSVQETASSTGLYLLDSFENCYFGGLLRYQYGRTASSYQGSTFNVALHIVYIIKTLKEHCRDSKCLRSGHEENRKIELLTSLTM